MKKFLSLACAFLMAVSCAGISANAEFIPSDVDFSSLEAGDFNNLDLGNLNLDDLNLDDLNLDDLNLDDLNLEDFTFDYQSILSKICDKLKDYIKESGIDAEVALEDGTISIKIFYEYDYSEACNKITAFMKENGINPDMVDIEALKKVISLLIGDATGDNDVDILDVIAVNKAMMGKETLTEEQLKAIDFNGNGKPDAGEAVDILKYIVGLIDSLTK